jgi:hypothetical protein
LIGHELSVRIALLVMTCGLILSTASGLPSAQSFISLELKTSNDRTNLGRVTRRNQSHGRVAQYIRDAQRLLVGRLSIVEIVFEPMRLNAAECFSGLMIDDAEMMHPPAANR